MRPWDYKDAYGRLVQRLVADHGRDDAMELAVGGAFDAIGPLERDLLLQWGLKNGDYVVDVGCGSGRLAKPLQAEFSGRYLGTDVVPELLVHAGTIVNSPDWRFELVEAVTIPIGDEMVDMVAFFSVFTHLLHEDSYRYLQEARRVLRPGGRIVFSFLEFAMPTHWPIFMARVDAVEAPVQLDMFLSRDAIAAWAQHLDLQVLAIEGAGAPHIRLLHPIMSDDGQVVRSVGLGQSVCVLEKLSS